jgi:hypothetical protein
MGADGPRGQTGLTTGPSASVRPPRGLRIWPTEQSIQAVDRGLRTYTGQRACPYSTPSAADLKSEHPLDVIDELLQEAKRPRGEE